METTFGQDLVHGYVVVLEIQGVFFVLSLLTLTDLYTLE